MLDAVVTDNTSVYRDWVSTMGVPEGLFHVVPFPAPDSKTGDATTATPGRLLWAGRMDRQKRPDLLVRIAQALPEFHFDVYGSSVLDGDTRALATLRELPNATYHGAYNDFSLLVRPEHLAFVYTTAWDGMPNIVLEAAAAGLPVVAPQIGGIGDLLPADHLVADSQDARGYCDAIRALAAQPQLRADWIERQNERLRSGRTWADFVAHVQALPNYVGVASEAPHPSEVVATAP
jgi:glycosyltransferase involved in cell wall biosynthesis